ncbi:acyltransferase [Aphelenchoides avenae]|nr:acyltransferase [Aphelenchus avenae]
MIETLVAAYIYSIATAFLGTVLLIFCGLGWGPLPHKYLQVVLFVQRLFPKIYSDFCDGVPSWNALVEKAEDYGVLRRNDSRISSDSREFELVEESMSPFELNVDLTRLGLEAIAQDEVSGIFGYNPAYINNELTLAVWRSTQRPALRILFVLSGFFRVGFLFPVRLLLYVFSFVFVGTCCILACWISFSDRAKTQIAVTYCRIYTAGTGLVARYHNPENRPTRPGIAVANHLSPNDIQIICADVNVEREYLYTVTGQKHQGIIWAIEHLVEQLCPCMWLERKDPEDRKRFMKSVLEVAKYSGPVLMFPEGYCTNNTRVLQFRRAVFEDGVTIHPIAIKQDGRFGDSFWSEDHFFRYLLRLLTSWATVYDVYYLEPQHRDKETESAEHFAARVQSLISEKIGVQPASFDGSVWYKKAEREKYRSALQKKSARELLACT